jgi:hypothetical protein
MGAKTSDADLETWVAAGIISADQADRIRAIEASEPVRSGMVREVVGYLGASLLAVAALVLVGDVWDDLGRWARVLLCAVAAGGLIATGVLVGRVGNDRTMRRLSRVALTLATIPLGFTVGIALGSVVSEGVAVLAGFVAGLGYGATVYRFDRSWASHVAVFASAVGTVLAFEPALDVGEFLWITGPLLFGLGAAWMTGATAGWLPPRVEGEVLGAGALGVGSVLLVAAADPTTDGGIVMIFCMVAMAIGCLIVGARLDRVVWLATGVIGLLGYLPWALTELLGEGVGVPIGLALAGIGLLTTLTRGRTTGPG